jgi:hypothetical protein
VVGAIAARVSATPKKRVVLTETMEGNISFPQGCFTASEGVGRQWALKPFNIYIFVWVDRGCLSEEKKCSSSPSQVSIDEQDQGA